MILNLLLLFFFGHNINEEIAIENLVGNWKRVCLENDALLSKSAIKIEKSRNLLGVKVKKYNSSASKLDAISHCNFFGDKDSLFHSKIDQLFVINQKKIEIVIKKAITPLLQS